MVQAVDTDGEQHWLEVQKAVSVGAFACHSTWWGGLEVAAVLGAHTQGTGQLVVSTTHTQSLLTTTKAKVPSEQAHLCDRPAHVMGLVGEDHIVALGPHVAQQDVCGKGRHIVGSTTSINIGLAVKVGKACKVAQATDLVIVEGGNLLKVVQNKHKQHTNIYFVFGGGDGLCLGLVLVMHESEEVLIFRRQDRGGAGS